ncbi:MAG: hypothetical protein RDV48_16525 [Candidatus Eremiobacteraeota bacterium]|nr:hypothetical protein [Candidatus Eremiobacteraeota bacterium]
MPTPPELKKDWCFYTGITMLFLSLVLPLFALLVPLLRLPTVLAALISGAFLVGGPEVLAILAVAFLGKNTFDYFIYIIKSGVLKILFPATVSKARYYTGLFLFLASSIPIYFYGYAPHVMPQGMARITILAASDLTFFASMFVMGGEFWEKMRRIFIWEGNQKVEPQTEQQA